MGNEISLQVQILAGIFDILNSIKIGLSGSKEKQEFLTKALLGEPEQNRKPSSFDTPDEFERKRKNILEGVKDG